MHTVTWWWVEGTRSPAQSAITDSFTHLFVRDRASIEGEFILGFGDGDNLGAIVIALDGVTVLVVLVTIGCHHRTNSRESEKDSAELHCSMFPEHSALMMLFFKKMMRGNGSRLEWCDYRSSIGMLKSCCKGV